MNRLFACFRKKLITNYDPYYGITCDINGFITDVSDDVLYTLLYERDMLIGQFIGIIMSPFMSFVHSAILLPKYKTASKFERHIMHIFLNGKTVKRPLIIYNIMKKPMYVTLSVTVHKNSDNATTFRLVFDIVNDFADSSVYLTSALSPKLFSRFRQTKNAIVIANIEFINASKYITDHSELKNIDVCLNFQQDVIQIIKQNFYPYIYVYENSNRGCVIVSNLCCTYNMPRFCTSLMLCFLHNLQKQVGGYASLRVGLTYEKAYIGATPNNQICIFGKVYDSALANMTNCSEDEVCCSGEFTNKLINEKIYKNLVTYCRPCYDDAGSLMSNVNFVDITKIDNIVLHETSHELNEVVDKEFIRMRSNSSDNAI
jgi:hypothetical protein